MAIRPPRPPRRPRDQRPVRDWTIAGITSLVVVVVLLRVLMAASSVGTWTVTWRAVELPTQPVVSLLRQFEPLTRTPLGHLSIADILLAAVVGFVALTILSSVALRRPD